MNANIYMKHPIDRNYYLELNWAYIIKMTSMNSNMNNTKVYITYIHTIHDKDIRLQINAIRMPFNLF